LKIASISYLAFSFINLAYWSDSFFFLPKFDIDIDGTKFYPFLSYKKKLFSSSHFICCSFSFFIFAGESNSFSYSTIIYNSYLLIEEFIVVFDFSTSYLGYSES
jgi:hypothetical protein